MALNDDARYEALVAELHRLADEAAPRYRALAALVQEARDTGGWCGMGDDTFEDWCRRVVGLDVAWMHRLLWVADHRAFVPDRTELLDFDLAQYLAGPAPDEPDPALDLEDAPF